MSAPQKVTEWLLHLWDLHGPTTATKVQRQKVHYTHRRSRPWCPVSYIAVYANRINRPIYLITTTVIPMDLWPKYTTSFSHLSPMSHNEFSNGLATHDAILSILSTPRNGCMGWKGLSASASSVEVFPARACPTKHSFTLQGTEGLKKRPLFSGPSMRSMWPCRLDNRYVNLLWKYIKYINTILLLT